MNQFYDRIFDTTMCETTANDATPLFTESRLLSGAGKPVFQRLVVSRCHVHLDFDNRTHLGLGFAPTPGSGNGGIGLFSATSTRKLGTQNDNCSRRTEPFSLCLELGVDGPYFVPAPPGCRRPPRKWQGHDPARHYEVYLRAKFRSENNLSRERAGNRNKCIPPSKIMYL